MKCAQVGLARDRARMTRATMGISGGHHVYALASGRLGHLVLHSTRRLHGRYVLSIDVKGYWPIRLTLRRR